MNMDYKAVMNVTLAILCILAVFSMWQLYEGVQENNELLRACDIQDIVRQYCGGAQANTVGMFEVNLT